MIYGAYLTNCPKSLNLDKIVSRLLEVEQGFGRFHQHHDSKLVSVLML